MAITDDFLMRLINSLSKQEKSLIEKYLDIFTKEQNPKAKRISYNHSLIIYRLYLSKKLYDENTFFRYSKCKNKGSYQDEKSKLKYKILDFLRIHSINYDTEELSRFRKFTDYGTVLKTRGEDFWEDSLGFLNKVISKAEDRTANISVLSAVEESSFMLHKLVKDNLNEVIKIMTSGHKAFLNIQEEKEVEKFYEKLSVLYSTTSYIKSEKNQNVIEELKSNAFYSANIEGVASIQSKSLILTSQMYISYILNNLPLLNIKIKELETFYHQLEPNAFYNTAGHKIGLFVARCTGFQEIKDYNSLEIVINEFKTFLTQEDPHKTKLYLFWARCNNFEYNLKVDTQKFNKKNEDEIYNHIQEFEKNELDKKVIQQFQFVLIRWYNQDKQYKKAKEICAEIINTSYVMELSKSYVEISRILELAFMFSLSIGKDNLDNDTEIIRRASSHYRHFKELGSKYYAFEMKFCNFFKDLENKRKRGLVKNFVRLKDGILQLEKDDTYGFIPKICDDYLNIYNWIDECISGLEEN